MWQKAEYSQDHQSVSNVQWPMENQRFQVGGRSWIRTSEGVSQQIYSLPPLATWVSYHYLKSETNQTPTIQHW